MALFSGILLAFGLMAAVGSPPAGAGTILPPLPTAPEGDVPGVNVWSCKPTAQRPEPVVIVHGTFGDRRHLLERLERSIKAAGFCVFALDYGNRATGDIATSAKELKAFVAKVLSATGASKVSMVGHSQGGMMPRYYIKFLGGAKHVDDLVGIAPSNHGTKLLPTTANNPLAPLVPGLVCVSCNQQAYGSAFLAHLNAGDETPGKVSYTQIESKDDEVVVPYTSAFLKPGPRTTNVLLQDLCPNVFADHLLIPNNKVTIEVTLNALTRPGPASKSYRPAC